MIALFLTLASIASGNIHRCGLESLPKGWIPGTPLPKGVGSRTPEAGRAEANSYPSLVTDHYAIWWTMTGVDQIQGGTGGLARAIAPGDSVPRLVRAAATGLERAWHYYVDTLGYQAPTPNSQSVYWQLTPPRGKFPVELCSIGNTNFIRQKGNYFGLTFPVNGSASAMLLGSDIPSFRKDGFEKDIDGSLDSWDYGTDWETVMESTAAHEEFHSVQFNYDYALNHFLFEASAVAMERVVIPQDIDYITFSTDLCQLSTLVPLTTYPLTDLSESYAHAWYVKQLVGDFGPSAPILKELWQQRAAMPSQRIEATLRTVISARTNVTFDTTLARYALRLGLSGRRFAWLQPGFNSFDDAASFATLSGTLKTGNTATQISLDAGQIQEWIDTLGNSADRIVDWIPDAGAVLGHAWKTGSGSGSEWLRGSVRQAASNTRQDVWSFSNGGPPAALRSSATTEGSASWFWTSTAPARTVVHSGQAWTWTDAGGAILTGTPIADTSCTPLLHTDIWVPISNEDPFAYSVVGVNGGHALVLEDADHVLKLAGASLTTPFFVSSAWVGRGDGVWTKASTSPSGAGTAISLDSLDLSIPLRILTSPGSSARSLVQAPYPNPSRGGATIHFPISGATEGVELQILSADGTTIRRIGASPGQSKVDWDVRNGSSNRVKPGVYWYIWRGATGATRGELLVAD